MTTKRQNETAVEYSERMQREASERNAAIAGPEWHPTKAMAYNAHMVGHVGKLDRHSPVEYYAALVRAGLTLDELCGCERLANGGYRVHLIAGGVQRDIS